MEERMGLVIDIEGLANAAVNGGKAGPLWSFSSADLNANVLRFPAGDGVPEHVNSEVDVLMLVLSGEAVVTLGGREVKVHGGQLVVLPKGVRRAIRARSDEVLYVTVHRRRSGLMPTRKRPS